MAKQTTSEKRLAEFRKKMETAGMVQQSGSKFLRIDMDGGYLSGKFISMEERKGKKYKNMELHLMLDITEGYGKAGPEEGNIKPGKYDFKADGNIPAFIERTSPQPGGVLGFFFKGKEAPSKKFKQGVKGYEIFAGK